MLDSLINFFTQYVSYWPLAVFIILLFAGLNIPVSEDALIIISAGISFTDHSLIIPNWLGLIAGIYVSDIMSYYIGRLISKGVRQFKAIRRKLTPGKIRIASKTLDDYGFRTFIVCRFIPFGVRNTLFMSSGFVHLPLKKFLTYDFVAALISCTTLYALVLFLGQKASLGFKIAGVALFVGLVGLAAITVINVIKKESGEENSSEINDMNTVSDTE